ncbi:GTP cyclohydrolase II [Myxococcota bacterium]|nr:GTP cyclohydrolase II [Myxococcota bacterium]MBU1432514.1 GTP cyclohydrolase II [Myxococcota bacterium]MBU1896809.1 GTP cyclohydrolase II [Myxococcota bacterium]
MSAQVNGRFYAKTSLPTEHGPFDLRVWRAADGKEHLALSVGALDGAEGLPVRVHSECLTGEVLSSLKCDCKAQLNAALTFIQRNGLGLVIYLRQEGRGIGLGNKIRAYELQAQGADTVDANRMLGFDDDLRRYDVAGEILSALNVRSVVLLTNNPAKIEGLRAAGVVVEERQPHKVGLNEVNAAYLQTKRARMGHLFDTLDTLPTDEEGEVIDQGHLERP